MALTQTATMGALDPQDTEITDTPGDIASPPLGRIGPLEVRLANSADEIRAAQLLRYRVFHREFGVEAGVADRRDREDIDTLCDHLIVVDTSTKTRRIVGTYRLLLHERTRSAGGFYSDSEFELSELANRHRHLKFLELGRSCVLASYRARRTIELLWQGIWAYCKQHQVDVMAGCASFPGTIPARHARALTFLNNRRKAEGMWAVNAVRSRFVCMDLMPVEAISKKAAMAEMPPLIKGYLRLGAMVGNGCVVDYQFKSTDVLIVLPRSSISKRYLSYYGEDATRFAA